MTQLDGPRVAARNGKTRQLVVLVHGYGADGNDLIELGHVWQALLPDAAFAAPHGPAPCGEAPTGREWFPLAFRDPHAYWRGVNAAAPLLDAFIDAELARHGLGPQALALVGFSQGTMMSLHVALRRAAAPAAVVGFSGRLLLPDGANPQSIAGEVRSRPPILLVHGSEDDLIPLEAMFHAAESLAALDIPTEWHVSRGVGHGIDEEGLRHGGAFLAQRFASMHA